ncbi:MAG: hypothetical protein QOK04_821, partial [Solirubrobacteraceae bacterium]|nr:hypothetical protein [Solirubrobacteraceae bacterium]
MAIAPARASTLQRIPLQIRRAWEDARSPAALIALGLGAAVAYAAFASGAIELPMEARLQVGVAALSLLSFAALLFAKPMRVSATTAGWAGLALLALFAIWTGATIAWSIAPDATWTELNRTLAYTLVAAIALTIGSSLPRAAERAAKGYLLVAVVVAAYALGGKAIPGVHIGPLDFNHTAFFSRLRAPLAYWNALSLFCVLAVPVAIQAAAKPGQGRRARAAAVVALALLLTTIGLTYSRGGVAALAVVVLVLLAAGPDRLRTAAVAAAGVIGAAPALAVGFTRPHLTHDLVPLSQRTGDGLMFAAALA